MEDQNTDAVERLQKMERIARDVEIARSRIDTISTALKQAAAEADRVIGEATTPLHQRIKAVEAAYKRQFAEATAEMRKELASLSEAIRRGRVEMESLATGSNVPPEVPTNGAADDLAFAGQPMSPTDFGRALKQRLGNERQR